MTATTDTPTVQPEVPAWLDEQVWLQLRHFFSPAGQSELLEIASELRELAPRINELTERAYKARLKRIDFPEGLGEAIYETEGYEALDKVMSPLVAAFMYAFDGACMMDHPTWPVRSDVRS